MAEQGDKTGFNERALAKLLEAAYVVQEHNRSQHVTPAVEAEKLATEAKKEADSPRPSPTLSFIDTAALESETFPSLPTTLSSDAVSSRPVSSAPVSSASAPVAKDDYATTLAQIVETQGQIRERILELKDPMALIAERVAQIARAGGAAIGILIGEKLNGGSDGESLRYRATAGSMTPGVAEVAKEKALCALCLRSSQVVRCPDADSGAVVDGVFDAHVDREEFRRRGIRGMIAVPIFHDGAVAGGLEIYYAAANAFVEEDVHTAQLMAGLVTEVLAREEEMSRRKSLAGERALMLEALERLQPNLAALVENSVGKAGAGKAAPAKVAATVAATTAASGSASGSTSAKSAIVCRKCGHDLLDEEQFCGKCGTPRSGDYEPPSMQSKVASMWHMQEALKKIPGAGSGATANGSTGNGAGSLAEAAPGFDDAEFQKMLSDSLEKEMPELFLPLETRAGKMWPETLEPAAKPLVDGAEAHHELEAAAGEDDAANKNNDEAADTEEQEEKAVAAAALAKTSRSLDWSSAASAREFLEQLAGQRSNGLARFWRARRGDFYLALAVVLVAIVIRWGIWSNHAVGATGAPSSAAAQHHKAAPDADLSWFDRTLVKLGLAEAPEPAEYKGNPDTEVWIDLRTALYYCPATDLYGKTPKGKFETQRDAQLDQFEPANRKACD